MTLIFRQLIYAVGQELTTRRLTWAVSLMWSLSREASSCWSICSSCSSVLHTRQCDMLMTGTLGLCIFTSVNPSVYLCWSRMTGRLDMLIFSNLSEPWFPFRWKLSPILSSRCWNSANSTAYNGNVDIQTGLWDVVTKSSCRQAWRVTGFAWLTRTERSVSGQVVCQCVSPTHCVSWTRLLRFCAGWDSMKRMIHSISVRSLNCWCFWPLAGCKYTTDQYRSTYWGCVAILSNCENYALLFSIVEHQCRISQIIRYM